MRTSTSPIFVGMAALATAVLVACGSSGGSTAAAPTPAAPAASPTSSTATTGTAVTATETEFAIALSTRTFTPGTYTFTAVNKGSATHALVIEGNGLDDQSTGAVAPGSSKALTVALKAGTYEIYCPVGNHKMLGMDLDITVS